MRKINFNKFDDDYLTALTNKGIVKRAYKDLEGIEINISEEGEEIKASFEDVSITLKENLSESICSCPSRSICKHIITAVLHIKANLNNNPKADPSENKAENADDTAKAEEVYFVKTEEILVLEEAPLLKTMGATALKKLYADVLHNRLPDITEGKFILVELGSGHKVRLLTPISDSVCSCKSSDICVHKAAAILYFKASKGALEIKKEEAPKAAEIDIDAVISFAERIEEEICHILNVGLSRISDSIIEHTEKLALSSHNVGMARHEGMFREISAMFESYFNRDVHFSEAQLLKRLSACYQLAMKIKNAREQEKLSVYMGSFRDEYVEAASMRFIPLGDRYLETISGYAGNVYYFLEEESRKVYSYSDLRPTFYDNNRQSFAGANLMWSLNHSIQALMDHKFELKNPKVSADRRLSSSNQIEGSLGEKLKGDLPISSELITYDFRKLITIEEKIENDRVAMVISSRLIRHGIDSIRQMFYMQIADENGYPISIELKNNKANKKVITILTSWCLKVKENTLFIGVTYIEDGMLKMMPIEFSEEFVPLDMREEEGEDLWRV